VTAMHDIDQLKAYVDIAGRKAYLIPVKKACNARCWFCATSVYNPRASEEMLATTRLPQVLELLDIGGVERIEVTGGGEPTLHADLAGICRLVTEYLPESKIKLYTNAARARDIPLVDEVNVSRVSWDSETNQRIMGIAGGSPDLKEVARIVRACGTERLRLSVPLMRGGVEDWDSLQSMARRAEGVFDGIVFRPLYPATPQRTVLEPAGSSSWWRESIDRLSNEGLCLEVELDELGCYRSAQVILASDGRLYSDWSMSRYVPGSY
jgi:MoaA/NifB/PqqE/SkfB family radical SAM enzyme